MIGKRRRVGLFGGSFNPPHLAHLALARLARDELMLDEVRWLPAGQPWQKPGEHMAASAHRLAMVQALIDNEPRFVVDNRELRRQGPSYTIDTVRELMAETSGAETHWFLIIGQDQYARFDTWREWPALLQAVTLAVAAREEQPVQPPAALLEHPHRQVLLPLPRHDISATAIRQQVASGDAVSRLVGDAVARYIEQHSLYRA